MIQILTTSFNTSPYIEKCLNSIKLQTIQDFQCWICDDVSSDGSQSYIECLIDEDSRFHLIANQTKLWQGGNYFLKIKIQYGEDREVLANLELTREVLNGQEVYILKDEDTDYYKERIVRTKGKSQKGECLKCGTDNSFHNALHCDECGAELKN